MTGTIRAVCLSDRKGIGKAPVPEAVLREDFGIEGDAHAGKWHRQVSLLSYDKVLKFNEDGAGVKDGDFGENLVVEGIDFRSLPVGTILRISRPTTGSSGSLPSGTAPVSLPSDTGSVSLPSGTGPVNPSSGGAECPQQDPGCEPAQQAGTPVLEMTQIGKECHNGCAIRQRMGVCIMPVEGVFARVVKGGVVRPGDEMIVELPDPQRPFTAAVITVSDRGAAGEREDLSGPAAAEMLSEAGYQVVETLLIPDEPERLKRELMRLADQRQVSLVITSGGTGFSMRDQTPEATMAVADRNAPGIAEAIRVKSLAITDRAMLSRGASVIRKQTLIVNLPGSPKAVRESLGFILGALDHGLGILRGTADN